MVVFCASNFASATESPTDEWTDGLGTQSAKTRCGEKTTDGHSSGLEGSKAETKESNSKQEQIDVEFQGYGNLSAPTVLAQRARSVVGSIQETSRPIESGA